MALPQVPTAVGTRRKKNLVSIPRDRDQNGSTYSLRNQNYRRITGVRGDAEGNTSGFQWKYLSLISKLPIIPEPQAEEVQIIIKDVTLII